jgi:histidinol-phosphate aminotransferase
MSKFLTQKYEGLKPYVPGEQPTGRKYIKLNTNESPYPPSENAIKLAQAELERLMLYPDPEMGELTALMAKTLGVTPDRCIMTNGSDEVLNFAFMAWCDKDNPAVFPDITYGFYKVFAELCGVPYKEIPLKDDFTICIEDYLGVKGTVFIANPNAPTGIALSISDIERIVASDKNRVVVVDEAYVDFGAESAVSLTEKYDNLLVTGTFSKSRSMAGARLGFGVGSVSLVEDLIKIKYSTNPYNVNRTTAAAGIGALLDKEYFKSNLEKIIETREWVRDRLLTLGFNVLPSKTNFLFVKSDRMSGAEFYSALRENGVLVRHFAGGRISDFVRVTIGSREEMQTFISIIESLPEYKG